MSVTPEQHDVTTDNISNALRKVVADHLKLNLADLSNDLDLGDDLCMDSLAAAELLVVVEESMGISLPPSLLAGREAVSYGEFDRLICEQVQAQS